MPSVGASARGSQRARGGCRSPSVSEGGLAQARALDVERCDAGRQADARSAPDRGLVGDRGEVALWGQAAWGQRARAMVRRTDKEEKKAGRHKKIIVFFL